LVHENVLRLHEVIKTPYFYYLILEYCPHGNLHEYIRQKKKLTEPNSIDIMNQVLAGYRYLIEQGVIHRDLKPANILRIGRTSPMQEISGKYPILGLRLSRSMGLKTALTWELLCTCLRSP
jgi:serine/threonine protein kinase